MWAAVPPWHNTVVLGGPLWPTATHTSQLKCLSLVRHGIARWSTLTCTMLCGMSIAAVGTVSLIYQDKCKHVKSQTHAARCLNTMYREPFTISSGLQDLHTLYRYPSAIVPPGLKYSTHPVSIWLWRSAAQPECQGQTGLLWLPRNLWTNVTTSVLTTFSKCTLNKDVVPHTLSQGEEK